MSRYTDWTNIQKAAQSVFPRLNVNTFVENTDYKKMIMELVKMGCGGFCVFGGDIKYVKKTITELQFYSKIPLLF
jgi:hypothetical protein